MNEIQLVGRLVKIGSKESGTSKQGKEWSNLTFVIETEDDKYPKLIAMVLFGDKTSYIEKFNIGDVLTVKCSIESREFNGKWFTNVNAFAVNLVQGKSESSGLPPSESVTHEAQYKRAVDVEAVEEDENTDLPF